MEEHKVDVNELPLFREGDMVRGDIQRTRRQFFIDKVKAPIVKALIILANRYPEPTKENTKKHNTHVLLDIWDEFFKYNGHKVDLFRAIRKVTVGECEHDEVYESRMTWFLTKLVGKFLSGEWSPLERWEPSGDWSDPVIGEALAKAMQEVMDISEANLSKMEKKTYVCRLEEINRR